MTDERLTPELHAAVRRIADAIVLSVPDDARALRETLRALIAERDELRAEIEMLRVVAEAFRVWTLASPNTVGESDALTQACDALSAYDVERVKRGTR